MNLNIIYNPEFEVKRLESAIQRLDWYLENGYPVDFVSIPNNLDRSKLKEYSTNEIIDAVKVEYEDDAFKKNAEHLQKEWVRIYEEINNVFTKCNLKIEAEYYVFFTKYGSGGSYHWPDKIFIKISQRVNLIRTVIHEIVHLAIQKYIEKYNTPHWTKERIVDLFCLHCFPNDQFKMQNQKADMSKVDKAFHKHFPNIETIIKNVS
ncbi:hypothetical protein IT397_03055 [Candidatus Nomurabacteria bacterium]|nr:hypothetical protein [Candidatus Nomurabacteria bacterium]